MKEIVHHIISTIAVVGPTIIMGLALIRLSNKKEDLGKYRSEIPTFDELIDYVNFVFNEVITMKFEFHNKLRDNKYPADMEEDIKDIATEVINAFSDDFKENIEYYVTLEYFYALITRKARMYMVDFVERNRK